MPLQFKRPRFYVPAALALCALVAAGYVLTRRHAVVPELAFSDFLQQVDRGDVSRVRFADGAIAVTLASGAAARTVPPPNYLVTDSFNSNLMKHGVRRQPRRAS